ncbi:MAG: hypothetical protein NVSMB31_05090 [Vulcanimicrobiaceae bacterium]
MTEHLAERPGVDLRVLADAGDHERIVPRVGAPWAAFRYHLFQTETSKQQARWVFLGSPTAESFWPDAQIVYCTGESYVPATRARLIVTMHDAAYFEPGPHRRDWRYWRQRAKWHVLYTKLARKADMFHTVSHFSASRLGHFFPSIKSRLRVVHNAVMPCFFEPASAGEQEYLTRQGLQNRPYVLLPGGLHHRKNADLVLKGWARIHQHRPELLLVIANHPNPMYQQPVDALGKSVRTMGFVDDQELRSLYRSARVVWFPSLYEGFGLPVAEAMACGAPVLASDSSSIPEVAGDAAVLVDANNVQAHVDALTDLAFDEPVRRDLGMRGQKRAARFRWGTSAAQLHECLKELV